MRVPQFRDQEIPCAWCQLPFVWTAQQASDQWLANLPTPRLCRGCRDVKQGVRTAATDKTSKASASAEARTLVCGVCGRTETYESDIPRLELVCTGCRKTMHRPRGRRR